MHVRRSSLAFLIGSILLISLSLILWSRSNYASVFPWAGSGWTVGEHSDLGIADGPLELGHGWLEPEPGDDTLRKNPQKFDDDAQDTGTRIRLSSPVLRERLHLLLDAPALSHTAAVASNEEACPRHIADAQVNRDQLKGNRDKWLSVNSSDIRNKRQAIVQHLERLENEGKAVVGLGKDVGEGRGIVMTAGNKDTARSALVTLRMLRVEYKSTLPVQIFSFPEEMKDESILTAMSELGATHQELPGLQKVAGAWKNFHLKAAAILASKFAEVLYLDSDNVPLRDPAYLFDEPLYKSSGGAVFWPDYNKDHPHNPVWRVLGKTCTYDEWEVESGQILIDKRGNSGLNFAALHIADHMQANHDFWFLLSGGDKDTFRYAFWALRLPYAAAPRWLSPLGLAIRQDLSSEKGKFCGVVMLQYDIAKNERGQYLPLFLHANLLKHRYNPWEAKGRRIFQTIKRFRQDIAHHPSLGRAKAWVYEEGGMCADLEIIPASKGLAEAGEQVITEQFEEVYGGVFKSFEDQWLKAGGRLGGG